MTNTELLPKEENATNTKAEKTPKPRSQAGLWVVCIFLLFAIIGIGAGGFWFYTQQYQPLIADIDAQRSALRQVSDLENQQLQLSAQTRQTDDSLRETNASVDTMDGKVSAIEQRVAALDNEFSQLSGARVSDWLIAEADYLSRMAGRKLWLEADTKTAIKLLEEADLRLQEAADPSLITVRRAIAADIQAIQQVNPVAVNSVALSLSGIISTVATLPLNALQLPEAESGEPEAVSENIADWQDNLARVWHALMDDFVTVRRREAAVEPMMSDAQRFLAQEQLKLSLMQAQHAALGHEATLYQESLKTAIAIIATHFDLQAPQITQLLAAIENLQKTNIERVLPPNLQSHQILQDTMMRKTRRAANTGSEI